MKLYYFDEPGRGEAIRLLLFHAGVRFEDIRIKAADWPKRKVEFELQQLPVLEVKGQRMSQSYAILEYLGVRFRYTPSAYVKMYDVMYAMNTGEDLFVRAYRATSSASPLSPKEKEEAMKQLLKVDGPIFLGALENRLKKNVTQDFIAGKKYTIGDFYLQGLYQNILQNPEWNKLFAERIKTKYPTLWAYAEKRSRDFIPYYMKCQTKLYYFDIPGRAEMIRLMLKHMGRPFEDVRIKMEDWPKEKASGKFELQQLPVVVCEPCGVVLPQTDAIMHRIGTRYGYLPKFNAEKRYNVLWWCSTVKDMMEGCATLFTPMAETTKLTMRTQLFEKTVPVCFQAMEARLMHNKSQNFLVGKNYTIADFYLLGFWRGFVINPMFPEFKLVVDKHPTLAAYFELRNKEFA